ncbi:uncharacterized protein LOC133859789 isoform X2 [Alnus glutinosa]|uniref:uncharacterized protein LOC133859789 isoform X2 n=1 Tax=Alnus glutinosa TaxID=3517 RepID=UPI002D78B95B|nr:uncharacterized protein LOC133859789 isoform X2 [Alnus glutinosa]
MAKPRVTITLGRTGQVVNRGGRVSDYVHPQTDTKAATGSKRFRRERVGGAADSSLFTNKRQRGDGINRSWGGNGIHGDNQSYSQISRHDLRLKLMRKKLIQRAVEERRKMDRRKKLSKTIQPSAGRNMLHQRSEPTGSPSWKMQPTERSQLKASRGLSPPRNFEDLRQVPSARAADASRAGWFLSNNGAYRPTSSTSLMVKGPPESSKPLTQLTSMSDIGQRSSHMVENPLTVTGLLQSLGLGKYNIIFRAEEVDMTALKQMGDKDLKDMGIPMSTVNPITCMEIRRAECKN